ncbi:protein-disulfide reductase DsbD domain-containing protein, partial [Algibacter lectus]|uniref:protein-disulfide reductase DsbD domain-containing protein n=1 Tax=Algibacter lectus TaxID=221126 RepID=UPI001D1177F2
MKNLILLLTLFSFVIGNSQISDPVKWTTSVEKLSETEYLLVSKATIESGWHLYSQNVPDDGPIPTTFTYDDSNSEFKILGNTSEEKGHIVDDPVFDMTIKFFEESALFKQKVKIEKGLTSINGFVEFMVCDDTRCLPPTEIDLVFNISKNTATASNIETVVDSATTPPKESNSQKGLWS